MSWHAPVVGPDTAPFWEYARARELRVQRCRHCGHLRLPPGPVCPICFGEETEWVAVGGDGVLQGWVTFRRQYEDAFPVPYTVALVELAEGPRLEGPLIGDPLPPLRWRMPVHLDWVEREGFLVPGFVPEPSDQPQGERP